MKKRLTGGPGLTDATAGLLWLMVLLLAIGCSGDERPASSPSGRQVQDEHAGDAVASRDEMLDDSAVTPPQGPESPMLEVPDPAAVKSQQPLAQRNPSSLEAALAALKVPPDWFDSVEIHYHTNHPWKDARLEIRRLLAAASGQQRGQSSREAMKLTYLYHRKNDIGDGHEYPMYMFLGGEYAWATRAYIDFTKQLLANPDSGDHIHAFLCLASCYAHFDEFDKALDTLNTALRRLPKPPWRIARQADIHDSFGDLYAKMDQADQARQHYAEAAGLYPTSNQPYGGHLLKRRAAKVQSKLDLLDYKSLATATLRDGTYRVKTLGYSGDKDVEVTVIIRAGRIGDVQIDHAEKIELGATRIIPQRIIDKQSLQVDAITGATVTCDAILEGAFRALKQAGLE